MGSVKKKFLSLLLALVCSVCCIVEVSSVCAVASAMSTDAETVPPMVQTESRGWITNLRLFIWGENSQIWAEVENQFTLFPSEIAVYVELYSSEVYRESYTEMILEERDYIADLNMGETIRVSASTGGKQKYWMARMRYKFNDRDWEEKMTDALLYSADGVCLS